MIREVNSMDGERASPRETGGEPVSRTYLKKVCVPLAVFPAMLDTAPGLIKKGA